MWDCKCGREGQKVTILGFNIGPICKRCCRSLFAAIRNKSEGYLDDFIADGFPLSFKEHVTRPSEDDKQRAGEFLPPIELIIPSEDDMVSGPKTPDDVATVAARHMRDAAGALEKLKEACPGWYDSWKGPPAGPERDTDELVPKEAVLSGLAKRVYTLEEEGLSFIKEVRGRMAKLDAKIEETSQTAAQNDSNIRALSGHLKEQGRMIQGLQVTCIEGKEGGGLIHDPDTLEAAFDRIASLEKRLHAVVEVTRLQEIKEKEPDRECKTCHSWSLCRNEPRYGGCSVKDGITRSNDTCEKHSYA